MRAFVHTRFVALAVVVLTAPGPIRAAVGEAVGQAGRTDNVPARLQIAVQTVDSESFPIPGSTVEEVVYGVHPKGYEPPTYTADQNGYVRLVCATNSAGISIRAEGFFGARVRREGLSGGITNRVRLRRSRLADRQADEINLGVPMCGDLIAPAALTDADILSAIRTAVAAPGMRDLPRQLWSIRIRPYNQNEGLARLRIKFNWNGGPGAHEALLSRTKDGWRLDHAGRIVE
jgi:hypothetical protein